MNDPTRRLFHLVSALGHVSRFRIVLALCARERHVSDVAVEVGLSQSCTTRHLQALERAEVIHTRRVGKRVLAALALEREEVAQVAVWLRGAGAPDAYAAAAAREAAAASGPVATKRRGSKRAARPGGEVAQANGADQARAGAATSATPPSATPGGRTTNSPRPSDLDDFLL